ncbi:hypothetical protein ACH4D5_09065 [Streptomyces sp. NPDC018029]|uniref:hypothetical protein n=1 Tax=Streptomyces sp. NPDC018029 TaxID=3365032 RepID=UPI0037B67C44
MPDFHPSPDWQQPSGRQSSLVDPVISVRQISRFGFARRTLTRIDHALVFSTAAGGHLSYLPPLRPSRREVAAKRCTAVYEVDMGVHQHRADITLPSSNDAFEFVAEVDFSWQVRDPAAFVRSGHRDVPVLLLGELQRAARPLARRFAIDDSATAEGELLSRLTAPGAACGLRVTWTLRLRRDQQAIDHERRLQSIDHTAVEQVRVERHGMAELRELEIQKIAFYQKYLEQGGVVAWAMHLAAHPEDSRLVLNTMREDQLRLLHAELELARELLHSDGTENYELEGPKRQAMEVVDRLLSQTLPGAREADRPEPLPSLWPPPGYGSSPTAPAEQEQAHDTGGKGSRRDGGSSRGNSGDATDEPTP